MNCSLNMVEYLGRREGFNSKCFVGALCDDMGESKRML